MDTRWLRIIFSILTLITLLSFNTWAQSGHGENQSGHGSGGTAGLCHVSKSTKLAMDQRDDLRLSCLKKKKSQINVHQCLTIANSMEYSTNAEEARLLCLYELRSPLTVKDCHTISKAMEYPDSGDEVRWECIRKFQKSLTKKQCHVLAKSMSYPANEERATLFCKQELD